MKDLSLPNYETNREFMTRMMSESPDKLADDDWSTLLAIALAGAQMLGEDSPTPGDQ
jgi:hypothetical protein